MTRKIITALALCGVTALAAAGAHAEGYVALSGGFSRLKVDCTGTTSCDKTGNAYKLLGGYVFPGGMAVEGGYFDFGKSTAVVTGVSGAIKSGGPGIGAAFHLPLGPQFNLVARLGVVNMKTRIESRFGSVSGSVDDTNPKAYFGLAAGWKFMPNASLDLSYDGSQTQYKANGVNEKGDVSAVGVGVTFRF